MPGDQRPTVRESISVVLPDLTIYFQPIIYTGTSPHRSARSSSGRRVRPGGPILLHLHQVLAEGPQPPYNCPTNTYQAPRQSFKLWNRRVLYSTAGYVPFLHEA